MGLLKGLTGGVKEAIGTVTQIKPAQPVVNTQNQAPTQNQVQHQPGPNQNQSHVQHNQQGYANQSGQAYQNQGPAQSGQHGPGYGGQNGPRRGGMGGGEGVRRQGTINRQTSVEVTVSFFVFLVVEESFSFLTGSLVFVIWLCR